MDARRGSDMAYANLLRREEEDEIGVMVVDEDRPRARSG